MQFELVTIQGFSLPSQLVAGGSFSQAQLFAFHVSFGFRTPAFLVVTSCFLFCPLRLFAMLQLAMGDWLLLGLALSFLLNCGFVIGIGVLLCCHSSAASCSKPGNDRNPSKGPCTCLQDSGLSPCDNDLPTGAHSKKHDDFDSAVHLAASAYVLHFQGSDVYHCTANCQRIRRRGAGKAQQLRPCKHCAQQG